MDQAAQPAVSANQRKSRRRVLVIGIAIFAFVLGASYKVMHYIAMLAALDREIALLHELRTGLVEYDSATGHFPATLDPQFQRWFAQFTSEDWEFLFQQCHLAYNCPGAPADAEYVILSAWAPSGDITVRMSGRITEGQNSFWL